MNLSKKHAFLRLLQNYIISVGYNLSYSFHFMRWEKRLCIKANGCPKMGRGLPIDEVAYPCGLNKCIGFQDLKQSNEKKES
jgi:hypothetical protein